MINFAQEYVDNHHLKPEGTHDLVRVTSSEGEIFTGKVMRNDKDEVANEYTFIEVGEVLECLVAGKKAFVGRFAPIAGFAMFLQPDGIFSSVRPHDSTNDNHDGIVFTGEIFSGDFYSHFMRDFPDFKEEVVQLQFLKIYDSHKKDILGTFIYLDSLESPSVKEKIALEALRLIFD